LILILISFCGMVGTAGYLTKFYYFGPFIRYLNGELKLNSSPMSRILDMMILFVIFAAVIFIIANVTRIIIQLLKKTEQEDRQEDKKLETQSPEGNKKYLIFSKFYYLYVTVFNVIILIIGVLGLLEVLNIGVGFIPFKITSF